MISIIIVNYNVYNDVLKCIESIKEFTKNFSYELFVVDNNSFERDIDGINSIYPEVSYIRLEENRGFGAANNIAIKKAKGEFILLMNPDIIIKDDAILFLYEYLKNNEKAGVVGPVLYKPGVGFERYYPFFPTLYSRFMQENWLFQSAPITKHRFTTFWDKNIKIGLPYKVEWVMAAALMFRKRIFDDIGGFDEAFFLYEEETEWQYRMSLVGWERYIIPRSRMIHNHHSSTSKLGRVFKEFHEFRSRIIFWAKHDKGLKRVVRAIMIYVGLTLRPLWFKIKYLITKDSVYQTKDITIRKLKRFFLSGKFNILNNRFDFKNDIYMFKK